MPDEHIAPPVLRHSDHRRARLALGRIFSTQLLFEPSLHRDEKNPDDRRRLWPKVRPAQMPTFSSNDRSRWATVRSLGDNGSYVIGVRPRDVIVASAVGALGQSYPLAAAAAAQAGYFLRTTSDHGIIFEDGWQSLDKVLRPDKLEFYSSKPPLLSTLVAGLYWLLKALFGWTLTTHPAAVVRTILVLVNAVPFVLYLQQMARLADEFGRTDWGKMFVVAAAAFGTLLTPFLSTLNNHTVATMCVLFTMVSVVEIWRRTPRQRGGLADEPMQLPGNITRLPASSRPLPSAMSCRRWRLPPRYSCCSSTGRRGRRWCFFLAPPWCRCLGFSRPTLPRLDNCVQRTASSAVRGTSTRGAIGANLFRARRAHRHRLGPLARVTRHLCVSPLARTPRPVFSDAALAAGATNHGAGPFALEGKRNAPGFTLVRGAAHARIDGGGRRLLCAKSDNYGGFTVGLRWLMWLSPLWLLCLLPSADRLGLSRGGRLLATFCLAMSVLSATYSAWNPWRHPWIYDLLIALGWPGY